MIKKSTLGIIGIGNPLRKDDGIGLILLNKLRNESDLNFDTSSFIDGGTGGMNLLYKLNKFHKVIILDAVDFKSRPGETRFFSIKEISSLKKISSVSTHNTDLFHIIRFGQELDECPEEIFIFGVQPKDVSHGEGLTLTLHNKIDDIFLDLKKQLIPLIKSYQL